MCLVRGSRGTTLWKMLLVGTPVPVGNFYPLGPHRLGISVDHPWWGMTFFRKHALFTAFVSVFKWLRWFRFGVSGFSASLSEGGEPRQRELVWRFYILSCFLSSM